jgi:two-component system, cell cycle sensor histidine kinase and response regulator CckA
MSGACATGWWRRAAAMAAPDREGLGWSWWRPGGGGAGEGGARGAVVLHEVLDAAPVGMALLDRQGRILHANPALAALLGPYVEPRPGTAAVELLAPRDRAALALHIAACLAGEADVRPSRAGPSDPTAAADAEWSIRCRRLSGAAAGGAALLLLFEDLTERRRTEARLATMARLEKVGRLAGGIAHDFNNLLGAVLGAADAMRAAAAAGLPQAAAEELRTIEDAAERGAALVRQLLAFARQQRLQPRVIELNAAVRGIVPLLTRLLGPRVRLELALEEPGRRVRVDPGQLDQVVMNLAANAREAMPEGGRLRIATAQAVVLRPEGEGPAAIPPGRYAVLEVGDTGTGIPPEILPRLFEPFFTTRPERGGTGLGLATVQGIVAQSGGHITVDSRVGQGTVFRIHLPRHEGPPPSDPPAEPASRPATLRPAIVEAASLAPAPASGSEGAAAPVVPPPSSPAVPPLRILLVEDEAPIRRLAERVLQRAGHTVSAADCAEAALEAVEDGAPPPPPDLVVSDVAMPGEDGLTLARRLRARWPGLPVLLMSGYAEVTLGQDLEAEGLRLLPKPFTPDALLAAVAEASADRRCHTTVEGAPVY